MIKSLVFSQYFLSFFITFDEEAQEVDNLISREATVYKRKDSSTRIYKKIPLKKILKPRILTSCFLSIFLCMGQTALAEYKPPKDQKPPTGHSDSSGVRVDCKINNRRSQSPIRLTSVNQIQQTNSGTTPIQQHRRQTR